MVRILVVDDDESVHRFLIDTLKFAGYDTLSALDGVVGLKLAEEHLPDLIIADIYMPHMDGYAMMEALRSHPHTNTIPVILLTAAKEQTKIRLGMTRGADDYIPKPVSPADILASVKTQLQKRAILAKKHDFDLQTLRRNIVYALPHEFRTPLSIILGYAQLLEMDAQTAKPDEILELSHGITIAGERLQRLIENYLVYAQLEVIASDDAEREAARNHVVKDAASVIGAAVSDTAKARYRLDDLQMELAPVTLRISEDNLVKIVSELVDNAFKFSPRGSSVLVKATQEDHHFTLLIKDHGRGMTADEAKKMGAYMQFGREFFEQQGVGLGFVISQRLVRLHDGCLELESHPQEGTSITIQFPVVEA
jgi:two-component system, sensor histidine kinase and response regulator